MKKKIAILGSTGSIGKTLLNIIKKDTKNYEIVLLTANKNYKELLKQSKLFKVKNLILTNKKSFEILKKRKLNINIYNNFNLLNNIFKKKIDYGLSAITGIEGLKPTINLIKYTSRIAIANKESIICGWSLIEKELKKNKTNFIPVDSEHFSLWYGLSENKINNIDKIYITASGGPLLSTPLSKLKNISIKKALNHPNWTMGKKISIDSATMINKIYEVIEAKNIFNLPYKKINILIHPKSYIHAIIKFNNGMIKIIAHDTTMRIPIHNTLFNKSEKKIFSKNINLKILNNLNFQKISPQRYPIINLLNYLPNKSSLYETVIVSANDTLVDLFLKKKIKFNEINERLFKLIKNKEFIKYKKIKPKQLDQIHNLHNYVRLKTIEKVYKS